jgi:uncharacterized protein with HEPN domain
MKSERAFGDYLQDMLDACLKASSFISNVSFDEFNRDEKTQFAVIRALEIIGEASKKIPQAFKNQTPDIPWRAIAGMRDKMIHDYMGVNQAVVWKTVNEDLPLLIGELRKTIKTQ